MEEMQAKPLSGPEQVFKQEVEEAAKKLAASVKAEAGDGKVKKLNWLKIGQIVMAILQALASKDDNS